MQEREPWLTGPLHGASWFEADLQVDPRAIARALAREAEAAGARVVSGCAVEAIEAPGGRVTGVRTAEGMLSAAAVVLAAGPWSAGLAAGAGLPLPLEPRKGQLVRLAPPAGEPRLLRHKVVDGGYSARWPARTPPCRSPPCSRPTGRGTCSWARAASGAASTSTSTTA